MKYAWCHVLLNVGGIGAQRLNPYPITYCPPPSPEEKCTVKVEAPCIYLISRGMPIVWKVIGDEIFRNFSLDVPHLRFPSDLAKSAKAKRAAAK